MFRLPNSVKVIRQKIGDMTARISELKKMNLSDTSYQSQELRAELRHLEGERQYDLDRIERKVTDPVAKARREAAIEYAIAEQTEKKLWFIRKLEAEGEYQQARIHRIDLQRIRERVEQSFNG